MEPYSYTNADIFDFFNKENTKLQPDNYSCPVSWNLMALQLFESSTRVVSHQIRYTIWAEEAVGCLLI
jgi:hypothetical protein